MKAPQVSQAPTPARPAPIRSCPLPSGPAQDRGRKPAAAPHPPLPALLSCSTLGLGQRGRSVSPPLGTVVQAKVPNLDCSAPVLEGLTSSRTVSSPSGAEDHRWFCFLKAYSFVAGYS